MGQFEKSRDDKALTAGITHIAIAIRLSEPIIDKLARPGVDYAGS
jgi:hypothetical protein